MPTCTEILTASQFLSAYHEPFRIRNPLIILCLTLVSRFWVDWDPRGQETSSEEVKLRYRWKVSSSKHDEEFNFMRDLQDYQRNLWTLRMLEAVHLLYLEGTTHETLSRVFFAMELIVRLFRPRWIFNLHCARLSYSPSRSCHCGPSNVRSSGVFPSTTSPTIMKLDLSLIPHLPLSHLSTSIHSLLCRSLLNRSLSADPPRSPPPISGPRHTPSLSSAKAPCQTTSIRRLCSDLPQTPTTRWNGTHYQLPGSETCTNTCDPKDSSRAKSQLA